MSVDLPDPDEPVMQTSWFRGILAVRFLRLCSVAPLMVRYCSECGGSEWFGGWWGCFRYFAVSECFDLSRSFGVPENRRFPPFFPASGPMSMTQSAARMVSSSCSTTTTVFPASLSFLRALMSMALSCWWRPMEGSSRTYTTPARLAPS